MTKLGIAAGGKEVTGVTECRRARVLNSKSFYFYAGEDGVGLIFF